MEELNWCIDYLISYNHLTNLKYTYNFNTFRALMNITFPNNLSDEYYNKQDHVLKELLSSKNVIDANSLKYINNIAIYKGDITLIKCDAIVNACNEKLLGCFQPLHNCIDNAIHSFAGLEVRRDLMEVMKKQNHNEENGKCKVTSAYNLPSTYIFHTVGPIIEEIITKKDEQDLANCYRSCLSKAIELNIKTIVFPCISTGIYGFDKKRASQIAYKTVSDFLKINKNIKVIFNVFTNEDYHVYLKTLGDKYDY